MNVATLTCDKGLNQGLSRWRYGCEPQCCESGGNIGRSSHRKCLLSGWTACCCGHKRQSRWDPWSRLDIGDPGWQVQKMDRLVERSKKEQNKIQHQHMILNRSVSARYTSFLYKNVPKTLKGQIYNRTHREDKEMINGCGLSVQTLR